MQFVRKVQKSSVIISTHSFETISPGATCVVDENGKIEKRHENSTGLFIFIRVYLFD